MTKTSSAKTGGKTTVGLISDTHGWLDPKLEKIFSRCALIVHAGDVGSGPILETLATWAPTVAVRGNIDGGDLRHLPLELCESIAGIKIGSLHIAGNPRRPNRAAIAQIRRDRPDVFVVGHSHIPAVGRVEGALWINPGAAGRQGFHTQRYAALIHIENGEISMDRIELGARSRKTIAAIKKR